MESMSKMWAHSEYLVLERWAGLRTFLELSTILRTRTPAEIEKEIIALRERGWEFFPKKNH